MILKKIVWLGLTAVALLALAAPEAYANCLGSVPWDSYKAGDEYVQWRGCRETYGSTRIEILNDHPYDLCVTVVALKTGLRWKDWPVASGDTVEKIVNHPDEQWQIGAVEKTKSYCD